MELIEIETFPDNVKSISKNLESFKEMSSEEILNQRKNKFLKIGRQGL